MGNVPARHGGTGVNVAKHGTAAPAGDNRNRTAAVVSPPGRGHSWGGGNAPAGVPSSRGADLAAERTPKVPRTEESATGPAPAAASPSRPAGEREQGEMAGLHDSGVGHLPGNRKRNVGASASEEQVSLPRPKRPGHGAPQPAAAPPPRHGIPLPAPPGGGRDVPSILLAHGPGVPTAVHGPRPPAPPPGHSFPLNKGLLMGYSGVPLRAHGAASTMGAPLPLPPPPERPADFPPCLHESGTCPDNALYGVDPRTGPTHCYRHARSGMVAIPPAAPGPRPKRGRGGGGAAAATSGAGSKCEEARCRKQASCGFPEAPLPSRCFEHKREGMVDLKNRRCAEPGCVTNPVFGWGGTRVGRRCGAHKLEGMVDVAHRRCQFPDCPKQPNFGLPGTKNPVRCGPHRMEGMEDITRRRCDEPSCKTRPKFGYPDAKKPTTCYNHKREGMTNMIGLRCLRPGCKARPKFGWESSSRAIFCFAHRASNMLEM